MDGLCDVRVYFVPAFHSLDTQRGDTVPLNTGQVSETLSVCLLVRFTLAVLKQTKRVVDLHSLP